MGECKWKPEGHIYVLALCFSLPSLVTRPCVTARVEGPVVPLKSIRCMEGCLLFIFAFDIGVFLVSNCIRNMKGRQPVEGHIDNPLVPNEILHRAITYMRNNWKMNEIVFLNKKNGVLLPRWTSVSTISTNSISGLLSCKKLLSVTVISKFANTVWAAFYTI